MPVSLIQLIAPLNGNLHSAPKANMDLLPQHSLSSQITYTHKLDSCMAKEVPSANVFFDMQGLYFLIPILAIHTGVICSPSTNEQKKFFELCRLVTQTFNLDFGAFDYHIVIIYSPSGCFYILLYC